MTTELPKQYDPKDAQARWIPFWQGHGYYDADPNPAKKPHTIMIPLPNVTGALHMGHCLNGTLQDLLTRWRRMQGFEALWMPGTDHAGIGTQAVVERRMLEEEGLTRHDIGREALVKRIWLWKDQYEARILNQLKQLGASCDWRRTRFTLDEICSRAVRQTFFNLFQDELIFRGKRLVNWDTYLQTAVADDEVFHETVSGHFWTFTYPVVGTDETIAFSTTRPETMLGDTAVAVHPGDDRYRHLVGKMVRLPLSDREIPIIADAILVDKDLGTGVVKVTPAHDPNDYACGQRNGLPMLNILNPDGTLNEQAGKYAGLDRYEARKQVVTEMERLGHLVKVEDREIEVAHSDRSKTPVEPYLSDQWFVAMDTLAENAINAVRDGRVKFFPPRYTKTYLDWLGEKRDWCISRQLWWGHQIPVWKRTFTDSELSAAASALGKLGYDSGSPSGGRPSAFLPEFADKVSAHLRKSKDEITLLICIAPGNPSIESNWEAAGFVRDPDVLDTWFSSALWPHETLGWPDLVSDPPLNYREEDRVFTSSATSGARPEEFSSSPIVEYSAEEIEAARAKIKKRLEDENAEQEAILKTAPIELSEVMVDDRLRDLIPESLVRETNVIPIDVQGNKITIVFPVPFDRTVLEKIRWVTNCDIVPVVADPDSIRSALCRLYGPETNTVLNYFYPTNVLVTSRDIITLWVARMVIMGLYNMQAVPFSHVCVHPKILDGFGQGMSKSKGNGVDPMDLIDKYGVDAVRFTIAALAGESQDVRLPVGYECPHCGEVIPQTLEHQSAKPLGGAKPRVKCPKCKKESQYSSPWYEPDAGESVARVVSERFEYGRNFCNKLWNASRFAMLNLEGYAPGPIADSELMLEDRWILSRLATTATTLTNLLGEYHFDAATRAIRDFTWNEFCDWYLEMIKPRLRDEQLKPAAQRMLVGVLDVLLRLLSPFTPFICEELWQRLAEIAPQRGLLTPLPAAESAMIAPWPALPATWRDGSLESRFERLQETIIAVRNVRAVYGIASSVELGLHVRCEPGVAAQFQGVAGQFENLAKTFLKSAGVDVSRPAGAASFSLGDADGYIPLEGIIDREAELSRQRKEADKLRGFIAGHEKKLTNKGFVDKAPKEVVEQVRETLAGLAKQLESVEKIIGELGG